MTGAVPKLRHLGGGGMGKDDNDEGGRRQK